MEYLNLFVKSVFIDNMVFAYFLGMCSYLAVSKNVKTALGLGLAVTFVLTVTLPVNYLLETKILRPGALSWLSEDFANVDLSFLSFIMFIAVIAAIVQIVEMVVEKFIAPMQKQRNLDTKHVLAWAHLVPTKSQIPTHTLTTTPKLMTRPEKSMPHAADVQTHRH